MQYFILVFFIEANIVGIHLFELPWQFKSSYNLCFYKEVDKSNLKTAIA